MTRHGQGQGAGEDCEDMHGPSGSAGVGGPCMKLDRAGSADFTRISETNFSSPLLEAHAPRPRRTGVVNF